MAELQEIDNDYEYQHLRPEIGQHFGHRVDKVIAQFQDAKYIGREPASGKPKEAEVNTIGQQERDIQQVEQGRSNPRNPLSHKNGFRQ